MDVFDHHGAGGCAIGFPKLGPVNPIVGAKEHFVANCNHWSNRGTNQRVIEVRHHLRRGGEHLPRFQRLEEAAA